MVVERKVGMLNQSVQSISAINAINQRNQSAQSVSAINAISQRNQSAQAPPHIFENLYLRK